MHSNAAITAASPSAIVTGPWSSRKAANGANRAKPSRLRASRRLFSSEGLIASIAASSAQPVSRPKRRPTCQYSAASMTATRTRRSSAGSGRHAELAPISSADNAISQARVPGNCSSSGSKASSAAPRAQARLTACSVGERGSAMRQQRQRAQAQMPVLRPAARPQRRLPR